MSILLRYFADRMLPELMEQLFGITMQGPIMHDNINVRFWTMWIFSAFLGFGGNILINSGVMSDINESITEAARVDGVNSLQEMFLIVIPMIWRTLVTLFIGSLAAIFTTQLGLYEYYSNSAAPQTWTIGYYLFVTTASGQSQYPYMAAFGLVLTCIIAPITLLTRWALLRFGPSED